MKKFTLTSLIAIFLFVLIASLAPVNAQSISGSEVIAPSIAITPENTPAIDSLVILDQQVQSLQAQADEQVVFKTQSQRIAYYETLKALADAKANYYALLASTTKDAEAGYDARRTAWLLRKTSAKLQDSIYAMAEVERPTVQHIGKLSF